MRVHAKLTCENHTYTVNFDFFQLERFGQYYDKQVGVGFCNLIVNRVAVGAETCIAFDLHRLDSE